MINKYTDRLSRHPLDTLYMTDPKILKTHSSKSPLTISGSILYYLCRDALKITVKDFIHLCTTNEVVATELLTTINNYLRQISPTTDMILLDQSEIVRLVLKDRSYELTEVIDWMISTSDSVKTIIKTTDDLGTTEVLRVNLTPVSKDCHCASFTSLNLWGYGVTNPAVVRMDNDNNLYGIYVLTNSNNLTESDISVDYISSLEEFNFSYMDAGMIGEVLSTYDDKMSYHEMLTWLSLLKIDPTSQNLLSSRIMMDGNSVENVLDMNDLPRMSTFGSATFHDVVRLVTETYIADVDTYSSVINHKRFVGLTDALLKHKNNYRRSI